MSGKYQNEKYTKKSRLPMILVIIMAIVLLGAAMLLYMTKDTQDRPQTLVPTNSVITEADAPQNTVATEGQKKTTADLGKGLYVTDIGGYTGMYMEDGTNELLSGILMLIVKNESDSTIQYAEITIPTEMGDAQFSLSTLPAGESVVILEKNRMVYTGQEDLSGASVYNVAVFSEPLSLHPEELDMQILDGAINVTNISGKNISGDIVIYYKNAAADLLYGGITYRVRIEGGMKAGEIKQIMATHFADPGSRIMFVTIG